MATDNAGQVTPADSAGPSSPPPSLPEGWLAQWEGSSRKWYYVQRTTGKSQWEIPTEPIAHTPSTTPLPDNSAPYPPPQPSTERGDMGGAEVHGESTDRGVLTNKLFGTLQGSSGTQGSGYPSSQSGGHSSVTQIAGGLLGKVANHALNGKPGNQQQQQQQQQQQGGQQQQQYGGQPNPQGHSYGGSSGQGGHSQGILPAIGHSLFGRHHHQNQQPNQFNYSSSGQASSTYAGNVPQYQAPGQMQNQPAGQNAGIPSTQPHGQVGTQPGTMNPTADAMNQQPHGHGPGFSQQVGVDAHGSLSSQFASRPPIPPPPGQPPSQVSTPPGMPPSQVPNQYQGVSSVPNQPGMHAGAYPSSGQQWNQAQTIPTDHGHGNPGQGHNTGLGAGVQQHGNFGQHPTGQSQTYAIHGSQGQSQAPTTATHIPNPTQPNQHQQTNQYGQVVNPSPVINSQYAPPPTSYSSNQQQAPQNPNQGTPQNVNQPQAPHGQHQYHDPNQGQGFNQGTTGYQDQTQPQNQYTTGAHQAPVYSQAGQPLTSQANQYNAYQPQTPGSYGGGEHLQQQQQQNPGYNPQEYGNQPHGSQFGGAPGR